jgi:hypothetical protein
MNTEETLIYTEEWHYSPCHVPECGVEYASGYYCSVCEDVMKGNDNESN